MSCQGAVVALHSCVLFTCMYEHEKDLTKATFDLIYYTIGSCTVYVNVDQ